MSIGDKAVHDGASGSFVNKDPIRQVDLTRQHENLKEDISAAIQQVIESGRFILGPRVKEFEQRIADVTDAGYAVGVASGTDALILALDAVGVDPGDEVVVPAFTFIATADAPLRVGARPVVADVDTATFNVTAQTVEQVITPKTKAVIAVHLYGLPAPMGELRELCGRAGVSLIEDAAQSLGAKIDGKPVGAMGDVGCFSFFPTKSIGALGDAGAIVTNNQAVADHVRMSRSHGSGAKYVHEFAGWNSRLDELQAAVLLVKLNFLEEWTLSRRRVAAVYTDLLNGVEGLAVPAIPPGMSSAWNQYTIRTARRNEVIEELTSKGVDTAVHYPTPVHRQPLWSRLGLRMTEAPVADTLSKEVLSLPMFPELTKEEAEYVAVCVQEAVKHRASDR